MKPTRIVLANEDFCAVIALRRSLPPLVDSGFEVGHVIHLIHATKESDGGLTPSGAIGISIVGHVLRDHPLLADKCCLLSLRKPTDEELENLRSEEEHRSAPIRRRK